MTVTLSHPKLTKSCIRGMGCDLGTANFGVAIVDGFKIGKYVTRHAEIFKHTIEDITEPNFPKFILIFYREMKYFVEKWRPDVIVLERFMNRGRFNGSSGEKISMMIGVIFLIAKEYGIKDVILVSASTWKGYFNRLFEGDLKSLYQTLKPTPPHLVDAQLQCFYGINKFLFPPQNPYDSWNLKIGQQLSRFVLKKPKRGKKKRVK